MRPNISLLDYYIKLDERERYLHDIQTLETLRLAKHPEVINQCACHAMASLVTRALEEFCQEQLLQQAKEILKNGKN